MRSSPYVTFAEAIAAISVCTSEGIGGRPDRAGLAAPQQPEPATVPSEERVRLHHDEQGLPIDPLRENDHDDPSRPVPPSRCHLTLDAQRQLPAEE